MTILAPLGAGILIAMLAINLKPMVWRDLGEEIANLTDSTTFDQRPLFVGTLDLSEIDVPPHPYALCLFNDYLYVSDRHSSLVTVFDLNFDPVKSLNFRHGDSTWISGIAVDDSRIYIADFLRGEIRFYDHAGKLLNAFSWLPGKKNSLQPYGLYLNDGVLYVTDTHNKKVFAISVENIEHVKEDGELLFSIPGPEADSTMFHCPSSVEVTPDGRILVADSKLGTVKVFTCVGTYAYSFTLSEQVRLYSPHGMARDNLPDPSLLEKNKSSFDPSGIRDQGRIHVVDNAAGDIVIFDATGNFLIRYGSKYLHNPNDIVIDHERRIIIVTETDDSQLVIFHY